MTGDATQRRHVISNRLSLLGAQASLRKLAEGFPALKKKTLFKGVAPWPELHGCLVILFTSRSGSTYLCRELEKHYWIGSVGESLNPSQLSSRARRHELNSPAAAIRYTVRHLGENGWFAFKSGNAGLSIAELSGFMEAYWGYTKLILLIRRDLVAQAISQVKADITSRYHSNQKEVRPVRIEEFSFENILQRMKNTLSRFKVLDEYVKSAGLPCGHLFYEQFETGDFSTVTSLCDMLEIPRRPPSAANRNRIVEKIGDSVNAAWHERFCSQIEGTACAILEEYSALMSDRT
jgi:hypothetical protein